jgi:GNAT superfamily N-acetyltransferase
MPKPDSIRIAPLRAEPAASRWRAGMESVFFEASPTKVFASEADRVRFRDMWLDRYVAHFPQFAFVALDPNNQVLGYVIGAADDPARDPAFADIAYFRAFAALTEAYPAHLHINLTESARNHGLGGRLIATFAEAVRAAGARGLHVVTSEGARNRGFYARQGFELKTSAQWLGASIVFLARTL